MPSRNNLVLWVIGALVAVLALIGFACIGYGTVVGIATGLAWNRLDVYEQQKATQWYVENPPLDKETIETLCSRFDLAENDPLCNGTKPVYAPDFFPIIIRRYEPGKTTFEQVDSDLGAFQYYRSDPVDSGQSIMAYEVRYDLKGDRASEIIFIFYADNILEDIVTRVGEWQP